MPHNKRDKVRVRYTLEQLTFVHDGERARVLNKLKFLLEELLSSMPAARFLTYDSTGKRTRNFVERFGATLLRRVNQEMISGRNDRIRIWKKSKARSKQKST